MKGFTLLFFSILMVNSLGVPPPEAFQEKRVIGWLERVHICPENLVFRAKMDTGAKNSSLNASNIEIFEQNGAPWVRFTVRDRRGVKKILEKKMLRKAKIKGDNGTCDTRPAILLGICLGSHFKEVEVNLTDRTGYNYQMLIGRSLLIGAFVVDPSLTFTRKPTCAGACGQ